MNKGDRANLHEKHIVHGFNEEGTEVDMAPFVLLAISPFLVPTASPAAAPTLTVVWNDFYELFPPNALGLLADEVHRLFAANGMSVRLHVPESGENLLLIPEPRLNAVMIGADGSSFGLGRDVMAAVIGERSKRFNVFVFFPALRRTLGHGADPSPRRTRDLTRALARVLAHELVHVLAPDRGHSQAGLMSRRLTRRLLLGETIELDRGSYVAAKARLERLLTTTRSSGGWT
jgi:hypothetical protein